MGCFKLPVGLCRDIKMLIRKFWWGQRGQRRKIHWKKWDLLCKPKKEGGLGFKELAKFNDAMLAKQVWRLINDKNSLFYHVFKSKYFPNGTIFYAKQSYGSYAWKSILKSRKGISMGAKWRVGDGLSISIFKDKWLPNALGGRVIGAVQGVDKSMMVANLIDARLGCWKNHLTDSCFIPSVATRIKAIPLSDLPQPNMLYWAFERNGAYSVKSRYRALYEEERNGEASSSNSRLVARFWSKLRKLGVPRKVKHFL
ncbi:uncharacterized mitochondrial protein AtMg00310-like [Quercus suber]|uniref:uncharacterized mitochondrial protein AtMg00310-like n=1 Tax=Quercus suber TaxID=58331 RepID=UPI0032DFC46C